MPSVQQLIDNVKNLSLVGATGSVDVIPRIEAYFNMAYREVYEMAAERYPWFVQTTQDVPVVSGSGTFFTNPLHILSVRDVNNSLAKLNPTDVLTVEDNDPAFSATGKPSKFWVNGFDKIFSYPFTDTTIRVRYTPNADILTSESVEGDIKLQPVHHDVLVWGTLKLMAYDERDKIVGAELAYNKDAHNEVLERMWRWFDAHAPKETKPIKSYLG